jgi:isohexenylglutaconyl-CoA hydratase
MIRLPETSTLLLRQHDSMLEITLNRPERKNALSPLMVDELLLVFTSVIAQTDLRAIVLRGAAHTFCAGADVKEMQARRSESDRPLGAGRAETTQRLESAGDPREQKRGIARANRRLGDLLLAVEAAAQPVVSIVEGAVLGGGIGLVCASDVALAVEDARFGLPETGIGLVPAQIAPFVVQRIGFTHAKRLMLTGARVSAREAERLGLVHAVFADTAQLEEGLAAVLKDIRRCAPGANARTKRLLFSTLDREMGSTLDLAAQMFAEAAISDEAAEGTRAFLERRLPKWAQ